MDNAVVVIGAINADQIIAVRQRPRGGETVLADGSVSLPGGKGANQAAAASRAGASTRLIGAVGDDPAASDQLAALAAAGTSTSAVVTIPGVATGQAIIQVTPDAENSIIVVAGANAHLDLDTTRSELAGLGADDVVVLQSEVAISVLDGAAAFAGSRGARIVINNGPWVELAASTLAIADPLVVNIHEAAEALADEEPSTLQIAVAVRRATGARSVIVTHGDLGVFGSAESEDWAVPAVRADRVTDTTGAGDTFVGTVAAALADGATLKEAAELGAAAAAVCVTWAGARPAAETPRFGGDTAHA